jgi:Fe-S cluster biosynthesis and repair protein YggX
MATITCTRCGQDRDQMGFQPFQNDLGRRVYTSICQACWAEWLNFQKQLINHYALDVRDPEAKQFLYGNMERFLFEEPAGGGLPTA